MGHKLVWRRSQTDPADGTANDISLRAPDRSTCNFEHTISD